MGEMDNFFNTVKILWKKFENINKVLQRRGN